MPTQSVMFIHRSGCRPAASRPPTDTVTYRCEGARTVQAVRPDTDNAVLTIDGRTRPMHGPSSATGARRGAVSRQTWINGTHAARLDPLKPGVPIASGDSVACHARWRTWHILQPAGSAAD